MIAEHQSGVTELFRVGESWLAVPSLGEMEAFGQFLFAGTAERPGLFEREYLHERNDDLFDLVTAITDR